MQEQIQAQITMYDKVKQNKKTKKDIKLTTIVVLLMIISSVVIISVSWVFGYHYRFYKFMERLAYCTTFANKKDSLVVEMDGKSFKITDENLIGIYNYINFSGSGKETKNQPDGEPIVLDFGNGTTIKFWEVPADKYAKTSGVFIQYQDKNGTEYSYINYKMTIDTIVTRYLLYDTIEIE